MNNSEPLLLFLSYRRQDSSYAASLIHEHLLETLPSAEVFMDTEGIPLGVDFRAHLESQLASCDAVLVVIGDQWIGCREADGQRRLDNPADFVRLEIETALSRRIPVIPVLVGQAKLPAPEVLPPSIRPLAFLQAAEVRSGAALKAHLASLDKGLRKLVRSSSVQREPRQQSTPRDDAYRALWQLLVPFSPKDGSSTAEQRSDLDARLSDWYYRLGNGMYLSPAALEAWAQVRLTLANTTSNAALNAALSRLRTNLVADQHKR